MSVIDTVKRNCDELAYLPSYGYDQIDRWGPNYDCSSSVITVWQEAGVPVKAAGATYTGNMKRVFESCGFIAIPYDGNGLLIDGDVLLNEKYHTAIYFDGMLFEANSNENGGTTGGVTGDQTGGEIRYTNFYEYSKGWDWVLRYVEHDSTDTGTYSVKKNDTLWYIAEKFLGDGTKYREIMEENNLKDDKIYSGMVLRIPQLDGKVESATKWYTADEVIAMIREVFGVE